MRFAHLSLFVWDFARSKAFYEQTVGLPVHHQNEHVCVFEVGGFRLVLIPPTRWSADPEKKGATFVNSHGEIGIEVDDVDALAATLKRKQVPFEGPETTPWGLYQVSLRDPDGGVVECYSRRG